MMFWQRVLTVFFTLLVATAPSVAQTNREEIRKSPNSYGLFFDEAFNIHRANFQKLPDVPSCCPRYESGHGMGPAAGIFVRKQIGAEPTGGALILRALYASYTGTLTADESSAINVNNVSTPATIEHTLQGGFSTFELTPLFEYQILSHLNAMAGFNVGLVTGKSYSQKETLIEPASTGTFTNGLRTRNNYSGSIAEASSLFAGLLGGLSYALPLNRAHSVEALPEIFYDLSLTPLVKDLTWNVSAIRFGIAIQYRTSEQPITEKPNAIVEAPKVSIPSKPIAENKPETPKPVLQAAIVARGVDTNGTETNAAVIRVEEFYSSEMTPILPYIFFRKDSSSIPDRYHVATKEQVQSGSTLTTQQLHDRLALYHDVLNTVSKRMLQFPKAILTITGCTSNNESDSALLASRRANAVADYIESVWGIDPHRLRIKMRGLPEHYSALADQDGQEENRRVELSCSEPQILAPIIVSDTVRTANPPTLRFRPSVAPSDQITSWKLEATQQSRVLKQFADRGRVPQSIDWELSKDQGSVPQTNTPLEYKLRAQTGSGDSAVVVDSMTVLQTTLRQKRIERVADKEIDRFSLILFDFASTRIDEANRRLIDSVKKQITPGTQAVVTGHTDRMGDAEQNRKLSELRANATASLLGKTVVKKTEGLGKTEILYDNNLPEGRFYSRTVDIVLEKPLKGK